MGMLGPKKEDLPKLLPADQMESALEMMADVSAYFHGASLGVLHLGVAASHTCRRSREGD